MAALVVSDVHLDAARPEIAAQFRAFLAGPARAAEALYVLGDLFEVWIGDDDPDPHKRAVIADLRALADAGVALYFLHGNRDFLLGRRFCEETRGTLLTDPTVVERDGRRALVTHGDALCTDDAPYQRLRALVRDQGWQAQFLALSVAQRQALAREARAGSQAHTQAQPAMLMDVNPDAVARVFRDAGVDTIIHGHTHRPGVSGVVVDGRDRTRIVTGDWYSQGSCLTWDAAGFRLEALPR
ncbi:MAG: UDP-2,3-diacylglucosamine diphosphatase [Proteobacteria bacterium]|nr:UDP-2,3-diacylglucosamine diphosphatase [Pseudomonadota bacterium]